MTQNEKTLYLEGMIADLDKKHAEALEALETITGNNLAVHTKVAARQAAEAKYERDRQNLVNLRNEAMDVSPAVQDFLKPAYTPGKLDVVEGREKLDTSLNPLGGKSL